MAAQKTAGDIKSEVLEWLAGTRYAATSLEPLSGGSANFIYRAKLSTPQDGMEYVLVKHGEGYMAAYPANELSTNRCHIEEQCLKELSSACIHSNNSSAVEFVVRTPKCYLYDDINKTQVQEYLANGVDLKTYVLKHFPSPTPETFRLQCHQLGKALAQWITEFHQKSKAEVNEWLAQQGEGHKPGLYARLESNTEMQNLKHMINYDWLIQRVDQFPAILEDVRDVFAKFKEEAMEELKREDLAPIHGDFWTGNVLLPDERLAEGTQISVFIVDWEMAQLGVPSLDHGEMLGELWELWRYKKIDAGFWMVQGYAEGLGELTPTVAWRIAMQVGCHLLSFGTVAPGWGPPDQVEEIARLGRDVILNAWQKNRQWFEESELASLFDQVVWDRDSCSGHSTASEDA